MRSSPRPGSAACEAGLIETVKAGLVERGSALVPTCAGHGLGDPDAGLESASPATTAPPEVGAALAQLGS